VISEVEYPDDAIERLFQKKIGHVCRNQAARWGNQQVSGRSFTNRAAGQGYLQAIDNEKLMGDLKAQAPLRPQYRPGKFVVKGSNLVMVGTCESEPPISSTMPFILGKERTEQQDVPINGRNCHPRHFSAAVNDPLPSGIDRLRIVPPSPGISLPIPLR